ADRAAVDDELATFLRDDRRKKFLNAGPRVGPQRHESLDVGVEPEIVADEGRVLEGLGERRVDRRIPRLVGHDEVVEGGALVERLAYDDINEICARLLAELVKSASDNPVRIDDDLRMEVL